MDISVFDIIGPVMMGPSSSGTAGMYRLGAAARKFFHGTLRAVELRFTPQFGSGYLGCRSHFGLLGGILGMPPTDSRLPQVVSICKEQGIDVCVSYFPQPCTLHTLAVEIILTNTEGTVFSMLGTSVGGGSIRIDRVGPFAVDISTTEHHVFLFTDRDVSGELEGRYTVTQADGRWLFCIPVVDDSGVLSLRQRYGDDAVLFCEALVPLGCTNLPPLFTTFAQLEALCASTGKEITDLTIDYEIRRSGRSYEEIWEQMAEQLRIMKQAAQKGLNEPIKPLYGYNKGDSGKKMMRAAVEERTMGGATLAKAIATAIATMEYSMALGCIVAAPTGGSAGIVPGTLLTVQQEKGYTDEQLIRALFVAAAVGIVMYYKDVSFSGSQGGCQAEVGVSSAMAAAAMVYLGGGTPSRITTGMALAMKNILGLICDPLLGCDEVPCIKRNGIGVANAFSGADMALAGIDSFIPPDEVVDALLATERCMPIEMRGCSRSSCGACGTKTGLASWETTQKLAADVMLPEK